MIRMQDDDGNNELVKITGVFKDLPANTHLKFDILFSYKTLFGRYDGTIAPVSVMIWRGGERICTHLLKCRPGTDPRALEKKFPADSWRQHNPEAKERNQRDILSLQPHERYTPYITIFPKRRRQTVTPES